MSSNDDNGTPPSPTQNRRASFASQRLSEFFGRSPPATGTQPFPGPIAAAAANAQQRRRMSIATIGLSASPTSASSPFGIHARQDSTSSMGSGSGDSAIDDSGDAVTPPSDSTFARRLSFGARAMSGLTGTAKTGESSGFNWSEQLRTRAQRSASLASPSSIPKFGKSASTSSVATQATPPPHPPAPPAVKRQTPPDHFQERILKGDFYMD